MISLTTHAFVVSVCIQRKSTSVVSLSADFEYACTLCFDSQVAVLLLQQLVAVLLLHVEFSDLAVTLSPQNQNWPVQCNHDDKLDTLSYIYTFPCNYLYVSNFMHTFYKKHVLNFVHTYCDLICHSFTFIWKVVKW